MPSGPFSKEVSLEKVISNFSGAYFGGKSLNNNYTI